MHSHSDEEIEETRPPWVEEGLTQDDLDAIAHGGCDSGAYMPSVTYYNARKVMAEHGDDVLEYLQDTLGDLPAVPDGSSWSQIAVHYLSCAVELWAGGMSEGY